ncbi:hypothetical protein [Lactobacillus crispatus]|uniref:hypothetical protein n=1 Tax=Lactobacillus crispatus TaxID=47770 RepID=UPI0030F588FE
MKCISVSDSCHFKQVNTVKITKLVPTRAFGGYHFKQINITMPLLMASILASGGYHFKQVRTSWLYA